MARILVVLTGSDYITLKNGARSTGFWAEEVVGPYEAFRDARVDIYLATPDGAPARVDESSLSPEMNDGDTDKVAYLRDYLSRLADRLDHPKRLEDVADAGAADYNAIFIPGGHGPMEDLPGSAPLGRVLINMCDGGKPVAAVCHGPAGLLSAERDGAWPFDGFRMTGFTNSEERRVGLAEKMPWLLETRLRDHGADFQGDADWQSHVVTDRNLVTGQNPQSARDTAQRLLETMRITAGT